MKAEGNGSQFPSRDGNQLGTHVHDSEEPHSQQRRASDISHHSQSRPTEQGRFQRHL